MCQTFHQFILTLFLFCYSIWPVGNLFLLICCFIVYLLSLSFDCVLVLVSLFLQTHLTCSNRFFINSVSFFISLNFIHSPSIIIKNEHEINTHIQCSNVQIAMNKVLSASGVWIVQLHKIVTKRKTNKQTTVNDNNDTDFSVSSEAQEFTCT